MANGDWDEVYEEVEAEYFVGREQELESFHLNIRLLKPRFLIYYITGQGGAGKTTLLNRCKTIAQEYGFLVANCDEQQHDVPSVLGRFAQQLTEQGFPLKDFNERYKAYRQKMHEIENDPEAPQGLAATLARTVVRAAFIGGDSVPGIRKGLEFISREVVETQASEWATYLAKKFANKDEIALVRDPVSILTPLFFKDVNEICQKRKVLLSFDNFEAVSSELIAWILRLREYKPSHGVRIAIAGRDLPGAKWDALRRITLTIRLDVFTEREAETFLDAYGIRDYGRRREILEYSGRLPVLMSWLSTPEGQGLDRAVPSHDIVERFLRWITESVLRHAALLAAIPRAFNLDILELLLGVNAGQSIDVQIAFEWLLTMPFVQQRSDSWQYHNIVRRMMVRYQKQKSPSTYQQVHYVLADFYKTKCNEVSLSLSEEWTNELWRKYTLLYIYHFIVTDPVQHWGQVMSLFVVAMRKRRSFAIEIIELLNSEDMHDELSQGQKNLVLLFEQELRTVQSGSLKDGFEMFDRLCNTLGLTSQAKCYVFAYRGEGYLLNNKWEDALNDFGSALQFVQEDAWSLASRGATYQKMGRYEEALADFDRAIEIDEKSVWMVANRGEIYQELGRFEEALSDFDRAIAIDKKSVWYLVKRGLVYRELDQLEKALADFSQAIILDENGAVLYAVRGEIYLNLQKYEEGLADINRAIALNEQSEWLIVRCEIYQELGRFEEALIDLNRAIALNEQSEWLIIRFRIYQELGRFEEALSDLDFLVAFDKENAKILAERGELYRELGRYEEALADLDRAITLDEENAGMLTIRGETYRLMGRYEEALAELDRALALDDTIMESWCNERGLVYSYLGLYADALECYEYGLRKKSNTYAIRYNIAVVMAFWKKFPDAQEYIDKARDTLLAMVDVDLISLRGSALYGLGGLAALEEKTDEALNYLAQSVTLVKDVVYWARHDIAWQYLRNTDLRFQSLVSSASLLERQ